MILGCCTADTVPAGKDSTAAHALPKCYPLYWWSCACKLRCLFSLIY